MRGRLAVGTAVVIVAVAGVVGVAGGGEVVPPEATRSPVSGVLGAAVQALGINEAVSTPLKREARGEPMPIQRLAGDARAARELGATWTRGHTLAWPRLSHDRWEREGRSWDRMDTWVRLVQQAGLQPVAMIGPWPGNHTREATSRFVLKDPAAYRSFVQAAVERYDGDGVEDMPGLLRPLHHWEIDNEPDLKNLVDMRRDRADDFATPAQFGAVLVLTASAIRQADPEAVFSGGGFHKVTREHGHRYMRELFAEPGVLEALDIVSVHAYFQGPDLGPLQQTIQRTRAAAPGVRIWVTETSVPAQGTGSWQSEDWQAQVAVAIVLECLALGVEKVFWHTLFDPPPAAGGQLRSGTRTNSLLVRAQGGELQDKPVARSWRALASLLEGVDRGEIQGLEATGGRAWQVGTHQVLWGEGEVSVASEASRAWSLVNGEEVPLVARGIHRRVDLTGRGGVVVLSP